MNKKHGVIFFFLISFSSLLLYSGCAFPRIIVLEDPLTPVEHVNLGVAYEKNGELESAIKEYKQAAKELPIAYLYLGNVYYQKNDLDRAEKYYKKAIKKEPGNADAHTKAADTVVFSIIGLAIIVASYAAAALAGLIFFGDATFILSPTICGPEGC